MLKLKRFILLMLISLSLFPVSCMDFSDSSGTSSGERKESPAPGKTGLLKSSSDAAAEPEYSYTCNELVYIQSQGAESAATLAANIMIPVKKAGDETFPAIIFINSWACEEHEYIMQAAKFARKGYVVLSYSCRGWGVSGGTINLGGTDDIADFKTVVDWLIANAPVDQSNIGVCGISLGGGGALNAVCHDSRIKTAVAISAWSDLERHMWSGDTPRMIWGSILCITGTILGRINPEIYEIFYSTLSNTKISWLKEWCAGRSPVNFIDNINRQNTPVYIANNTEDYLFPPDTVLDFFNALTVDHKRVDLSLGTHFTGEATGLLGLDNYVFTNVHNWFDYWLKGVDTGIIADSSRSAVVTIQEKNYLERVTYDTGSLRKSDGTYSWPPNNVAESTFYLAPRSLVTNGSLKTSINTSNTTNSYWSGLLSGATAGALIFPILEQLGVEVTTSMLLLNRAESIAWESSAFTSAKKIRGASEITLRLSLSQPGGQVIVYLYDVDRWGRATYITHGFQTFWNATAGEVMEVTIPVIATAYDIPAGHHLAVVIDSSDPLYAKPSLVPFTVKVSYSSSSAKQNVLTVPFEN